VRAPLVKKMDTEGLKSVLVLAGMPGSGATTVACNLALACAGSDDRVLIIDANVRRPAMHRVFGISDPLGLADCLAGQTTLAEAVRPSGVPNLSVLTAGSAGNRLMPERLSTESMSRLLAEASTKYDRIFIDCPPAIVSGDGLALANRCDAVVMVVRALNEKRGLVNRIRMQLSESRAELLGVVVNAVKSSAGGYFKRNIQATHEYHNTAGKAA
jgi:capsular exopolysaccharide synthesis family protein